LRSVAAWPAWPGRPSPPSVPPAHQRIALHRRYLPGGGLRRRASLIGTIASAFSIAQTQSTAEFFLTGSMAKVLTLSAVILILMLRPQGLFSAKVRK
jgi:hypothetical protein